MTTKNNGRRGRKTAVLVGLLFIVATTASILGSAVILAPLLEASDYLANIAANEDSFLIGILLELTNSMAVVAISVALFPLFRKQYAALASGYIAFRVIESVILIVGSISLLSLLTLSREMAQASATDSAYVGTLGTLLMAVHNWTDMLGAMVAFSLTALILNTILLRSRLVPRWISAWGLIGAPLMLAAGLLGLFGLGYLSPISVALALPLALNEMVLAVWLIAKGFDVSHVEK